jgi:hypothetical protein
MAVETKYISVYFRFGLIEWPTFDYFIYFIEKVVSTKDLGVVIVTI